MLVLLVATVSIAAMSDADVIKVRRYCACSKIKCRASSLNSRAHTSLEWTSMTQYKQECRHLVAFTENTMASTDNKHKYDDNKEAKDEQRRR
jgi:hypothetical protein